MVNNIQYPKINDYSVIVELPNTFVYLIKKYELNGISITIEFDDRIHLSITDWKCNDIDLNDRLNMIVIGYIGKLVEFMSVSKIKLAQYYFSYNFGEPVLVDVRFGLNKFCGPGYLNDFFGKMGIPIQKSLCDPRKFNLEEIKNEYENLDCIIKQSSYKNYIHDDEILPMYATLSHRQI